MKKTILALMALCLSLFACSGAEDIGSTQEAVCGSYPTPNGTIATYIPPQVPNKTDYINSLSGNSTSIHGTTNNGNVGDVGFGTASRFTCTGTWAWSAARGPVTHVVASALASGGCRFALTDLVGTTNLDCAATDGGTCTSMSWNGTRLQNITGTYVSGVAKISFGGVGSVTQSTTVSNNCP